MLNFPGFRPCTRVTPDVSMMYVRLSYIPVSSAIADRDPPLVACATVKCARQGLEDEGHAGEAWPRTPAGSCAGTGGLFPFAVVIVMNLAVAQTLTLHTL